MRHGIRICGFSLIELMIVVCIIGILTAVAVPSYRHYIARARFTEVIGTAEIYKTAVAVALQQGISASELQLQQHGIPEAPPSTKTVANVEVAVGVVTITGTSLVDNATYTLTPNDNGSQWTVGGSCLAKGLCSD